MLDVKYVLGVSVRLLVDVVVFDQGVRVITVNVDNGSWLMAVGLGVSRMCKVVSGSSVRWW